MFNRFPISKSGLFFVVFLGGFASGAARYFIDNTGGSNTSSGMDTSSAWKSLGKVESVKLSAGDSVFLRRGSAWTDSLRIRYSGSAQSPVVITCYGPASSPLPRVSAAGMLFQVQTASNIIIEKISLTGGKWSGVEIADTTDSNIVIQDLEISNCGGGLYLAGKNIVVRNNYIHDGKMVVNTQGAAGSSQANDDYGATGINLGHINGCSVYDNRLVNLRAPSFDYGYDGGSIEFWRSVRNCEIYRNFSWYVDGFTEFGGIKGDSMVNISIHHNITFECGNFVCFHIYDSTQTSTIFGVNYKGVKFDHNLAVTRKRDPGFILLADGARLKDSTLIQIRNNIFASDSLGGYVYENASPSNKSSYMHTNNIVWCPLRNPFAHGEKAAAGEVYANPLFTDSLWDKPGTLDSTVAGYVPMANGPAAGSGAILGYATDYLGNKVLRGTVTDIGPLAIGSTPLSTGPAVSPGHNIAQIKHATARIRGDIMELSLQLDKPAPIRVRLFDVRGKTVASWNVSDMHRGHSIQSFALPSLSAGMYFLSFQAEGPAPAALPLANPLPIALIGDNRN